MKFDTPYYEDDIREGYLIPSMIKRSWATQLDILQVIREICEKHQIKWFADCGTLIGAIRHGGFIPWDDDLDICMLRDDYEKFHQVVGQELPEGYKILSIKKEVEYEDFLTRITGSGSINLNLQYLEEHHGFPYVSGVDIFPLDYIIPDDNLEEMRRGKLQKLFHMVSNIESNLKGIEKEQIIQEVEALCNITVNRELPIKAALLRIMEDLFKVYDGADAQHVALMPYWVKEKSHKYPIEYFKYVVEVPFETTVIQVPAAYGEVLKIEYGAWEIANRRGGIHEYPFYQSQENIMEQHFNGTLPFKYYFSIKDLESTKENDYNKKSDSNLEILKLMSEANVILWQSVLNQDYNTAVEILQQSQTLAINVGTSIEEVRGEGNITVSYLEDYCELLYEFSQVIVENNLLMQEEYYQALTKQLSRIEYSYIKDRKKTVVFFPFHHRHWCQMEFLYRKYSLDESVETYVIPIPYYERNVDGTLGKEYYEIEMYPSYLNPIDYRSFDFEHTLMDELIIQCPYDEYNSAFSVHPFFYGKNLKKYGNKLTYIPYFVLDEIEEHDFKSLSIVPYYAITPGVVYSDKVIVSSDNMRQLYLNELIKLSHEIPNEYWINKITTKDMEYVDKENIHTVVDTSRSNSSLYNKGKILLLYSSISDFLVYGKRIIDKLKENISILKLNDTKVLWVNEYGLSKNLKQIVPSLYNEYQSIVEDFMAENIGEYYEGSDISDYVARCDAYYGPGGYVMNLCHRKGVPVMLHRITQSI